MAEQQLPPLRIAQAGNPNCGKTTVFSAYTGTHQHVGNYPGVTVDKKEGEVRHARGDVLLVDLPGTYSLTAYSMEEVVARQELASGQVKSVIDVVDASALERNLMLTVQMMEMGLPVVLACNMMDEARKGGIHIDMRHLSEHLGIPVLPMVARTGEGLDAVMGEAMRLAEEEHAPAPLHISYGSDIDPVMERMAARIAEHGLLAEHYLPRWVALKLLEGDSAIIAEARHAHAALTDELMAECAACSAHVQSTLGTSLESVIIDYRYGFIRGLLRDGVITREGNKDRLALSDTLDKVLTNALLGPVLMLGVMYGMFYLTFEVGAYPQGWVENAFGWLGDAVSGLLPDGMLKSLLVSGIIDGVGGVVSFVPLIMIMFALIAFFEDSGYMARIAYMLDRVFRIFGLHGASVMPYIVSGGIAGGCAIPGVMATRTLRSPKEKLATLLTLPFMTCGAKLPVFLLLVGVFFPENPAATMFLLMLTGWVFALVVAWVLRHTIIRGEATPFVMELPPYRLPSWSSVAIHCWERTWMYLKKAGTVLVAISIILWASMTFPQLDADKAAPFEQRIAALETALTALPADAPEEQRDELAAQKAEQEEALGAAALRYSVAGRIGAFVEPATLPMGFDWRTDIALIGGIAAKEAIVSTLGTAYSLGEQDPENAAPLAQRLESDKMWNKATALSLMLFVLLYSPCFVALVVIKQETGSWGWLCFSMVFNTLLASGVSLVVYQIGSRIWGV